MTRRKNAFRGLTADVVGMVLVQLLTLAAIRYYLRFITPTDYGYWIVIASIVSWIGLADFGIGFAVTRLIIRSMNQDEEQSFVTVNKVANTGLLLFAIIAALFLVVGFLLIPFLLRLFHVTEGDTNKFITVFSIILIANSITIPFAVFGGILEARQKIALNRNIQTISQLLQLVFSFFFVAIMKSVVGIAIAFLLGAAIGSLVLYIYARREKVIRLSKSHIDKNYLKELVSLGGYFQVGKTANLIATSTDSLFIASYMDVARVQVYNFTSKLPMLFCNTIASKIPNALFSGMSQVLDQNKSEVFADAFNRLLKLMIRISFFSAIIILFLNSQFISLWVGPANFGGTSLNYILVYIVFFETIIRGTGMVFQVYGELKYWAFSAFAEAALNIALSIAFLYKGYGFVGLAMATAIARTATIGIYWAWFIHQKKIVSYSKLLQYILKNGMLSIPVLLVLYIIQTYFTFHHLLVEIVTMGVMAVVIHLLVYDWKILVKGIKAKSFKVAFMGYIDKY